MALKGADVGDEELAVEMVYFVLQGAGVVPRSSKAEGLAPDIERFYFYLGGAFDLAVEVG